MSQETFVLNPETCRNLMNILRSTDTTNLDVAEETIRYIDVEANLPYLLLMFKVSNVQIRDTVFMNTIKDKLNKVCKKITFENANQSVTYDQMYEELIKHKVDPVAMRFFLDIFGEEVVKVMQTWGFSFLETCKVTIDFK